MQSIITMDYGSGGLRTAELIDEILLPAFGNAALNDLGDGAVLPDLGGRPVFSTDSFVVTPWKFPGGDIGKLAVCGTVNDVCMAGGKPLYLSLSLILEEGLPTEDLHTVVQSIARTAREAGVVTLIARGLTNEEIAQEAHISINTLKTYIRSAYRKMGVERRSQAVRWGIEHGAG